MHDWYLSYDGGQVGPLSEGEAKQQAQENPNGLCWRDGFAEWVPIASVSELSGSGGRRAAPPPPSSGTRTADEIDYKIFGEDMQYVEVELDPGESAVAEAGAMMFKDPTVNLDTVFGDGAKQTGGFFDKLVGAGKRLITGESLFMTVFTHQGPSGKARVGFAAPYPGTIIPLCLANFGGEIICQKDSFLAAAKGVQIGIHFQKRILTGLFGGEGFIMQKLNGDGQVFLHAGGTIREVELAPGQTIHVDTGCLVGHTSSVDFDLQQVGGVKSMFFGGEGLFFANLKGPGHVWLQSLPFSRMAGRMLAAAPARSSKGEGTAILGGLTDLLDGDNF